MNAFAKPTKAEKRNEPYLEYLRCQRCDNHKWGVCWGDIVPCHTPHAASNGMGTKVDDRMAIPMCVGCHNQQHQKGWVSFCKKYGLNYEQRREYHWAKWQRYLQETAV